MTKQHQQALLRTLAEASERLMSSCNVARDAGHDELAEAIYATGQLIFEQIRMVHMIAKLEALSVAAVAPTETLS